MFRLRGLARIIVLVVGISVPLASSAGGTAPTRGGTLTVGISGDVSNFVDWFANAVHELEAIGLVFRQLAYYDRTTGEFTPGLAKSWAFEAGGTSLVFTLRGDARWEDGRPVTAADVVFTYTMQVDPAVLWFGHEDKAEIKSVEAIAPDRVRFTFKRAYPGALFDAISGFVYPAHELSSIPPADLKKRTLSWKPVGCGPFRIGRREAGQGFELLASDTYYGGRPYLDRIVFRVADKESRALMFEKGELDMLRNASAEQFDRFTAGGKFAGFETRTQYVVIGWNCRTAPFDDARVRRALALAVDRDRLVKVALRGHGAPAYGPIAPGSWAAPRSSPQKPDLGQAKRLLDAAGYTAGADGRRSKEGHALAFELLTSSALFFTDVAEILRAAWEPLGIRVTVRPVEAKVLRASFTAGKGDAWLYQEQPDDKVDLTDLAHSKAIAPAGLNYAGYASPAFDAVCERARTTADRNAARPLWIESQRILADDQPYTFLVYRNELNVVSARFKGVRIDANGLLYHVAEWWTAVP